MILKWSESEIGVEYDVEMTYNNCQPSEIPKRKISGDNSSEYLALLLRLFQSTCRKNEKNVANVWGTN